MVIRVENGDYMIEFILKDSMADDLGYIPQDSEHFDYLVRLFTKDLSIIQEIRDYIYNIETYEDWVGNYLKDFLNKKGIKYEITPLSDMETIIY